MHIFYTGYQNTIWLFDLFGPNWCHQGPTSGFTIWWCLQRRTNQLLTNLSKQLSYSGYSSKSGSRSAKGYFGCLQHSHKHSNGAGFLWRLLCKLVFPRPSRTHNSGAASMDQYIWTARQPIHTQTLEFKGSSTLIHFRSGLIISTGISQRADGCSKKWKKSGPFLDRKDSQGAAFSHQTSLDGTSKGWILSTSVQAKQGLYLQRFNCMQ